MRHNGAGVMMTQRPDVLLLCVDDMNDWVGCLHGYPGVHTPNIDRSRCRTFTPRSPPCAGFRWGRKNSSMAMTWCRC